MARRLTIGVDLGNYNTKTRNTISPSSYEKYRQEPKLASEVMFFGNEYYTTTNDRNNQMEDKTEGDYALHMTLFAISKEIIEKVTHPYMPVAEIMKACNEVKEIRLGVGLPVGHFSKLSDKLKTYYENAFRKSVAYSFRSEKTGGEYVDFNFEVVEVHVFPQDITAVAQNPSLSIPSRYKDYYVIGLGGGTVDIIPVENGLPCVPKCTTILKATTDMYDKANEYLQKNGCSEKDYSLIEKVIMGEVTAIKEEEKKLILEFVSVYAKKLVDVLIRKELKFSDYPTVFVGGGALLLKPYLEKNPVFVKTEFVSSVNENAKFYELAMG